MNDTTAKVFPKFQQDTATAKVFHRKQFVLYGTHVKHTGQDMHDKIDTNKDNTGLKSY